MEPSELVWSMRSEGFSPTVSRISSNALSLPFAAFLNRAAARISAPLRFPPPIPCASNSSRHSRRVAFSRRDSPEAMPPFRPLSLASLLVRAGFRFRSFAMYAECGRTQKKRTLNKFRVRLQLVTIDFYLALMARAQAGRNIAGLCLSGSGSASGKGFRADAPKGTRQRNTPHVRGEDPPTRRITKPKPKLRRPKTSKPPTRRITSPDVCSVRTNPSKPPTRRITCFSGSGMDALTSKPPTRRITYCCPICKRVYPSKPPTRRITGWRPSRTASTSSKPPTRRITRTPLGWPGFGSSKPPTRRITSPIVSSQRRGTSKPPTRRITRAPVRVRQAGTSKPPTRRITFSIP